jgi:hypothetical protein
MALIRTYSFRIAIGVGRLIYTFTIHLDETPNKKVVLCNKKA